MGVVYQAWDARLKRHVAVKLISPELSDDPRFRERFLTESERAAALEHPNVIPIHHAGELDGHLYLVMRYVAGSDLRRLLAEGPVQPARAIAILTQLAAALDAAHARGLVHRDVKPSNVLLDSSDHVYLADFGLTRTVTGQGSAPGSSNSIGTAAYAAPEQIRGEKPDAAADRYALGCVLYECLTNETPFPRDRELAVLFAHLEDEPPPATRRNSRLPQAIDPVLARALAKRPGERYASCGELIESAGRALGLGETDRARGPLLLLVAGLLLALVAGLGAVLLARDGGQARKPSTVPLATPSFDALQRIDPETNQLVATLDLGSDPTGVAVGGGAVWTIHLDHDTVSKIDPQRNALVATESSPAPKAVAVGGGFVWVANGDGTLSQLDPSTATRFHEIPLPGAPQLVAYGASAVWAASPVDGVVARVNPQSARVGAALDLASQIGLLKHIAVGKGAVWVTTSDILADEYGVVRIDPATNRRVANVPVQRGAVGVAAGDGAVWVANPLGDTVSRIDPTTNRVVGVIGVGKGPIGVAVGDEAVWVTNHRDGTVSRIDPNTGRVVATIGVGPNPDSIAVGEGGVWVTVHAR